MKTCSICVHPNRAAIDKALIAGVSARQIAAERGVSQDAVDRHRAHLPSALVDAAGEEAVKQALDVLVQLKAINDASLQVLREARQSKNGDLALRAVDRLQRQIELQSRLLMEAKAAPVVNILLLPEWSAIRTALLSALRPYPEAAAAAADALAAITGGQGAESPHAVN